MLLHSRNHMGEVVIRIRILAIRIDSGKSDSTVPKRLRRLSGHLIRPHHIRAVIAGEENDQDFRFSEVAKGIAISVCSRQIKVRADDPIDSVNAIFNGYNSLA